MRSTNKSNDKLATKLKIRLYEAFQSYHMGLIAPLNNSRAIRIRHPENFKFSDKVDNLKKEKKILRLLSILENLVDSPDENIELNNFSVKLRGWFNGILQNGSEIMFKNLNILEGHPTYKWSQDMSLDPELRKAFIKNGILPEDQDTTIEIPELKLVS